VARNLNLGRTDAPNTLLTFNLQIALHLNGRSESPTLNSASCYVRNSPLRRLLIRTAYYCPLTPMNYFLKKRCYGHDKVGSNFSEFDQFQINR
jgi:hypothetical protein